MAWNTENCPKSVSCMCNCCLSAPALWPCIKSFFRTELIFKHTLALKGAEGWNHTSVSHIQYFVFLTERRDIFLDISQPSGTTPLIDMLRNQHRSLEGAFSSKYIRCYSTFRVLLPLQSLQETATDISLIWGGIRGCRACCLSMRLWPFLLNLDQSFRSPAASV